MISYRSSCNERNVNCAIADRKKLYVTSSLRFLLQLHSLAALAYTVTEAFSLLRSRASYLLSYLLTYVTT